MTQETLSTASGGPDIKPLTSEDLKYGTFVPLQSPPVPACNLCKHWRGSHGAQAGSCRRHPPQVIGSQEYRWPVTAADSDCGEFALDGVRQKRVREVSVTSAEEELRMRRLAAELLEKAESGGFDHPEFPAVSEQVVSVTDTLQQAPFVSPLVPKPTQGLKPNVPKPHIPVLTVEQMRKFKGQAV